MTRLSLKIADNADQLRPQALLPAEALGNRLYSDPLLRAPRRHRNLLLSR